MRRKRGAGEKGGEAEEEYSENEEKKYRRK